MFTNLKYPNQPRNANRSCKELRLEDRSIRLGTVAWLQSEGEPIEHILVIKDSFRTFILMTEYRANPKRYGTESTEKVKPKRESSSPRRKHYSIGAW